MLRYSVPAFDNGGPTDFHFQFFTLNYVEEKEELLLNSYIVAKQE